MPSVARAQEERNFDTMSFEFLLKGSSDVVVMNGTALTLGEIVEQKRATDVNAQISYYKIVEDLTAPSVFQLERTHWVHVVCKKEGSVVKEEKKRTQ